MWQLVGSHSSSSFSLFLRRSVGAAHECEGDSTRRVYAMECRAGNEGRHAFEDAVESAPLREIRVC